MKERIVMIIQARMGSTRLPGKSLMKLAGKPLVERILERVLRCKMVDNIVLAVPHTKENEVLKLLGKACGVDVFAGSENDLLDRYLEAAMVFNADVVVRLPADNVTPEPEEIDRIIDFHLKLDKRGFTSNLAEIRGSGYPDGIGAEVFDVSLLKQAAAKNPDERFREHVHLNFFDYATGKGIDEKWCPINTLLCPEEFRRPDIILDVNTQEQYENMLQLYEDLYPRNSQFHIKDIIQWHDAKQSKSTPHVAKAK